MSDPQEFAERLEKVLEISPNAFIRLLALQHEEASAAGAMRDGDGYCDFFVEGAGPPWHEAFEDVITGGRRDEVSELRMAYVDRLRAVADGDDYCDFFVEGAGPPWHEAFEDVISERERLVSDPYVRANALSRLRVMDAYARLRAGSD